MANAAIGGDDPRHLAQYVNAVGSAISLAVLIFILVWGAKTLMRDASGVPVVRAIEGPMRVAPDNPQGVAASNQGLSVNEVASSQETTRSGDIRLAPRPLALADGDNPAISVRPQERVATAAVDDAAVSAIVAETIEATSSVPARSGPVARSLRPSVRSVRTSAEAMATTTVETPAAARLVPAAVSPAIAPGTRLAQLGAYESAALAEQEWRRISSRYASALAGKGHVVQAAERGGKTFYRLRVVGFNGAEDARRFCSAMIAQNAACYPVLMK